MSKLQVTILHTTISSPLSLQSSLLHIQKKRKNPIITMTSHTLFALLLSLAAVVTLVSVVSAAGAVSTSDFQKITREERNYRQKKVIDISHKYVPDLPAFGSKNGLGNFIRLQTSIKLGDLSNDSVFNLSTHSGTHVDAPGHFNDTLFELGYDVVSLDLRTLNGPVLVVETPRNKNITAEVMRSLNIPRGVKRVLFRTLNTDRRLMYKKEFDSSYTAFTSDGAEYLVQNTDIKLVGVDYLSVAINPKDQLTKVHQLLLAPKDIIPVEGLKLDDAVPGVYTIHCLPLRLNHGDGSPARCILFR
ncbi:cyclase-like protein 1 [Nicotiana tabacum]|uniref:Cyclase-like protein 1 n=1 Tax=Nicotiana tabacum TaxID=4097 RepID=A0AC58ULI9_TOBAC